MYAHMFRFGFNIAPAYLIGDPSAKSAVAARAVVNTTLSGCSSALTVMALVRYRSDQYELRTTCNGILAGFVAVSALTGHVEPW